MLWKSRNKLLSLTLVAALTVMLSGFSCNNSTKKLAIASDAIAHGLLNAQQAAVQGVQTGVMTQQEYSQFNTFLITCSQRGLVLNNAIRQGESAQNVSQALSAFLDGFNALNQQGLAGIKNANLKVAISTIISGMEASVAVIAAAVGTPNTPPAPAPAVTQ